MLIYIRFYTPDSQSMAQRKTNIHYRDDHGEIYSPEFELLTHDDNSTNGSIGCDSIGSLVAVNNQLMPNAFANIFDLCAMVAWFHKVAAIPCSYKTAARIEAFIKELKSADQWRDLTTPTDYALVEFRKRMLPYFSVDSKEWRASCVAANQSDYPAEFSVSRTEPSKKTAPAKKKRARSAAPRKKKCGATHIGKPSSIAHSIISTHTDAHINPVVDLIMEPQDWSPESAVDKVSVYTRNNNFLAMEIEPVQSYRRTAQIAQCIIHLFAAQLPRLAIQLFYYAMLCPASCDVFRYGEVLSLVMNEVRVPQALLQYAMYYSLYLLRHEETIMFSQVNPRYRVLFTLEEAAKFPQFKGAALKANPYIQQLTDQHDVRYSAPFFLQGQRMINDAAVFARRFQIATGGIFDDLDLAALGATITGSILIPCVHKSPLEALYRDTGRNYERAAPKYASFTTNATMTVPISVDEQDFFDYLEEFYPSYVSLTDEDFDASVLNVELVSQTKHAKPAVDEFAVAYDALDDTRDALTDDPQTHAKDDPDLSILWCRASEIKKGVHFNQLADIDCGVTCETHEEFKRRAIFIYKHVAKQIALRCTHPVYITEVKTISSIKYKIHGPGMCRPMDIFRVPYGPEKMVKKFHVQFVRMFYDGQLRLFRSCVTSLLSGMSDTYKWFSCNKIPIDVILKYAQRGLTTMLNNKERIASSVFLDNDARWGLAIKAMKMSTNTIWQCVTSKHPFFMPSMYNCGIRMDLRSFIAPIDDVVAIYPDVPEQGGNSIPPVKTNDKTLPPNYDMIDQQINDAFLGE